jgi:hypothetical protein
VWSEPNREITLDFSRHEEWDPLLYVQSIPRGNDFVFLHLFFSYMHKTLGREIETRREPVLFSLEQEYKTHTRLENETEKGVLRQELRVCNGLDRSLGPIKAWTGITSNLIIFALSSISIAKKKGWRSPFMRRKPGAANVSGSAPC